MTSPWSINPVTSVTVPTGAGPNDAAIFISGTDDLPPCMQADFVAAVFYRPYNAAEPAPIPDAPSYFTGVLTTGFPGHTDVWEGFSRYDPSDEDCDYTVWHSIVGEWDIQPGPMQSVQENYKCDPSIGPVFGFINYDEGILIMVEGELATDTINSWNSSLTLSTTDIGAPFVEVAGSGVFIDATGASGDIVNVLADGNITIGSNTDVTVTANGDVTLASINDAFINANGSVAVNSLNHVFLNFSGVFQINGDIDWSGSTTVQNEQSGTLTTSSLTYALLGNVTVGVACQVDFIAPPSGQVLVSYGSLLDNSVAANACRVTFEITNGSGTGGSVFRAASSTESLYNFGTDAIAAGRTYLVTGLTPGNTYNAHLMQRSDNAGNNGTFNGRTITVAPAM